MRKLRRRKEDFNEPQSIQEKDRKPPKRALSEESLFQSTISYEEYIFQKKREHVWSKSTFRKTMMVVKCWMILSIFGIIYLVFIGKLTMYQPRYMNGLFKKSNTYDINSEYIAFLISYNAFNAAKAYAITILLCFIFLRFHLHLIPYLTCKKKIKCRKRRRGFPEHVNLFEDGKLQYGTFVKSSQIILPLVHGKNKKR